MSKDLKFLQSAFALAQIWSKDPSSKVAAVAVGDTPNLVAWGWCGSHNNLSTIGFGAWKVVRIAKSGRYLLESLEGNELNYFLNDMGYPELIK